MPMALKQDVLKAKFKNGHAKPIDLAHLGNQTFGDEQLEQEILSVFCAQSKVYLDMMTKSCDSTTRIRAAHSLKGAARAIGAFELAELAAHYEKVRHEGYEPVEQELGRVIQYIHTLN